MKEQGGPFLTRELVRKIHRGKDLYINPCVCRFVFKHPIRELSGSVVECLTPDQGRQVLVPWRHCLVVLEQDTFILA